MAESFLLWRRYGQSRIKPTGMSLKQAFILGRLAETELNPSQIAELLFSDRATTSVILRTMKQHGWIHRAKDVTNRKFIKITITSEGRRMLEDLTAHEKRLPQRANPFACFSTDEQQEFERLVRKLRSRMNQLSMKESGGKEQ